MPQPATQSRNIPPVQVLCDGLCESGICSSETIQLWCWGQPRIANQRVTAEQLLQAVSADAELATLGGHFALVIYWPLTGRCRIYADRFVTHRLYYHVDQGRLWISDNLQTLTGQLDTVSIDQQALVNYLFFHMIPSPQTVYRGVYCLEPAQRLEWDGQQLQNSRWWMPDFEQAQAVDEQQCAEQLLAQMRELIPDYIAGSHSGCFLSGGLDSSSIAGLVSEVQPQPDVFSIGFPVEAYNELDYARTAVNQFDLQGHEYIMSPEDVLDALPKVVGSMEQPFGNSSVMPAYFCAKLARQQGVERLIAGDGGDELFAGNERYAKQLQLDHLRQRLAPVIGLMDLTLLKPSWPESLGLIRKARSLTRQLKMTVPQNLEYFNFLNLIERKAVFSDKMLETTDQQEPDHRCQRLFDEPERAEVLDRMLYMDWKHTLADNDLVKVNSMCRLAGVEVAYPMLDDRLVDFSLRVPATTKLTPANLRHLYKLAMRGFLPDKIIQKSKHGFGLPFGLWTAEHPGLKSLAYEAIASLDQYDLFRPGFIDDVKRRHQYEHAKHYGELVWILMVLALWLDNHSAS